MSEVITPDVPNSSKFSSANTIIRNLTLHQAWEDNEPSMVKLLVAPSVSRCMAPSSGSSCERTFNMPFFRIKNRFAAKRAMSDRQEKVGRHIDERKRQQGKST